MDVVSSIGNESCLTINELKKLVISQRQPEFPEVDATFAKAIDFLDQCHVRISVVGQVKAGKSTLINVLSGAEDLLPTEVNPWTAVITNLHFGHVDKPHVGGVFQLFSEDEWQRMLEGDKETRSLAENLLPGFDSAILKEQVEEMQEKARKRLGSLYKHLLGKSHKFNSITPEILERYVSAGHQDQGDDMDESANAGRFSGITKSAEVFLERGPFSIPVTMSDTPGINDPFLVRDEITTTSFRDTDIFVVAISIHQALGAADMALLKMLSRHSGKATVIFVNRIDEVDEPATDVPEILKNLEKRLEAELDGSNYQLIAGSAHWGHIAQHGSDKEVSDVSKSKEFKAYCKMVGVGTALAPRERLFVASGVSNLGQALSDRIADGPIKSAVARTATEVTTAVGMLEKLLTERLKNEEVALLDVGDVPAIIEAEKNRLIARINSLADLADELDENEDKTRFKLMENGEIVANSIRLTIEATLARFVDSQSSELGAALSSGSANAKWSLDTAELGQRIEEQTVECYQKGRSEVDDLIDKFASVTDHKTSDVLAGSDIKNLLENLPHDEIFPGFKPSTTLVDIELVNERGWKFWKKAEMTKDEAISRVQKIIRQEMLHGVSICCETARLAIAERTGEALLRISKVKLAARNLIIDEVNTLKGEIETLDQGVNKKTIARINANRATRAKARRKQVDQLAKAKAKLIKNFSTEHVDPSEPLGVSGRKAGNV